MHQHELPLAPAAGAHAVDTTATPVLLPQQQLVRLVRLVLVQGLLPVVPLPWQLMVSSAHLVHWPAACCRGICLAGLQGACATASSASSSRTPEPACSACAHVHCYCLRCCLSQGCCTEITTGCTPVPPPPPAAMLSMLSYVVCSKPWIPRLCLLCHHLVQRRVADRLRLLLTVSIHRRNTRLFNRQFTVGARLGV